MPLQLRRGNTAEVNSITPLVGEIVYDTQLKRILVGDGSTAGGTAIAGITASDSKQATFDALSAGSHQNITFTQNAVTKAISAKVDILSHDTIESDAIITGKIFNSSSSVVVDVDTGTFTGNVTGNLTGNTSGTHSGAVVTNSISSSDSSTVLFDHSIRTLSNLTVDNNLIVESVSSFYDEIVAFVENDSSRLVRLEQVHNSQFASALVFVRKRGTFASPSIPQAEDSLGDIDWNAPTTTGDVVSVATIKGLTEGTITGTAVPGRLDFFTADSAGAMTRRMYLDSSGLIYLDGSTRITNNGYSSGAPVLLVQQFHTTADARNITIRRARGTDSVPAAVVSSDEISEISVVAHDGSGYVTISEITHTVDGAVSTGVIPSRIDFTATNEAGTRSNKLSIKGRKTEFLTVPVLPTYADETAADAAIGGSGNRVNGMMYYDTALGKVRAVAGGSWTSLH